MTGIKRLFFAAHIHSDIIITHLLPQLKQELKTQRIAWANPQQMHVTLKFFGDTPTGRIAPIEDVLFAVVKNQNAFEIKLEKVRMFGSRYKPQVIWIGIEDNGQLKSLFEDIRQQLVGIGILPDRQNFVPHLTLGRIKELSDNDHFQNVLKQYSEFNAGNQRINELILYESRLEKTGAVHIPVKKFQFIR